MSITEYCAARLTGLVTFQSNTGNVTSDAQGNLGTGAVFVRGVASSLDIDGQLCAEGNAVLGSTAAGDAGFLKATYFADVFFGQPQAANVNGNTPNDIVVTSYLSPKLACNSSNGPDVKPSWWPAGAYNVTGGVCACEEAFFNGTATTCDSCRYGWDTATCACKVSWPTWEELQSSLVIVLVASLIFSLLIYGMDLAFSNLLSAFYHLFK